MALRLPLRLLRRLPPSPCGFRLSPSSRGLRGHATVQRYPSIAIMMSVVAPDGSTVCQIDPEDEAAVERTGASLKRKIQEVAGVPMAQPRLLAGVRELADDEVLPEAESAVLTLVRSQSTWLFAAACD